MPSGHGIDLIKDAALGLVAGAASLTATDDMMRGFAIWAGICTAVLLPLRVYQIVMQMIRERHKRRAETGDGST